MSDSLFDSHWYRIERLRPVLRSHVDILRHQYRGENWWVVNDAVGGRQHRLDGVAHYVVALMDGERTIDAIWNLCMEHLGEDAPSQTDVLRLLSQLHSADLLQTDVAPDLCELLNRYRNRAESSAMQRYANPLFLRFSLWDPDPFLTRTAGLVRPLFTTAAMMLWLIVVVTGLIVAASHITEIVAASQQDLLTPTNILTLWLVYPLMKLLHELAHAYAVKRWGGSVHEMGLMLMVLLPVPYVDASAAANFRSKRQRMLVSSAGIFIELLLAAVAMLLWIAVEPGLVRQVAFDVMLIGAVSSVFFNGNPLLRFDGYYVLADAIEIPNLATRARSQLGYLARRWLFRVPDIQPPAYSRGEALWLTGYGLGAFVYRLFVTTVIAIFLASHYLVIGVGLALWAVFSQVLMPIANGLRYLATSPEIASRRQPVAATVAALCAVGVLTATLVPVGATTTTTGVVWPSEDFVVRVGSDCFVREIAVPSGQKVGVGSLLLRCDNIDLIADRDVERDRLQEIKRKHQHLALRKQVKRKILADEIALVTTIVAALEARVSDLSVYSDVEGIFVVPDANSLVGRFIPQGRIIGYIVNDGALTVRAVVSQDEIGLVRTRTEAVTLRPSADVTKLWRSHVVREVPAASNRLPSPALGTAGGGPVAVSASDPTLAIEPVFQVELAMPAGSFDGRLGGHVYVRFEHGAEPLVAHAARLLRQLFLKYFEV